MNVICLGLCPADDFGTSGVEPSDSATSTVSFCEPLSLLCEILENNDT